jgi:hypothetical protein
VAFGLLEFLGGVAFLFCLFAFVQGAHVASSKGKFLLAFKKYSAERTSTPEALVLHFMVPLHNEG